jgi:hypothetical protein|tara:strand:+ start:520 stop:708 length:189 start_codon:yes stop_codon:yes gene_type:complete
MIEWVTANVSGLVQIALQVAGAFAIIAAWTPNTSDNKVAAIILDAVNFLGANLNKAKNAPDA